MKILHLFFYVLIILVYPYQGSGFRFLIPVIPFIVKYILIGLQFLFKQINNRAVTISLITLFTILLLQNRDGIKYILRTQTSIEDGPQKIEAEEAIEQVKKLSPETVVLFSKPRALSFYSGVKSVHMYDIFSAQQLMDVFSKVDYYLLAMNYRELNDITLTNYLENYPDNVDLVWGNNKFHLYKNCLNKR